jgi:hypothetical protein
LEPLGLEAEHPGRPLLRGSLGRMAWPEPDWREPFPRPAAPRLPEGFGRMARPDAEGVEWLPGPAAPPLRSRLTDEARLVSSFAVDRSGRLLGAAPLVSQSATMERRRGVELTMTLRQAVPDPVLQRLVPPGPEVERLRDRLDLQGNVAGVGMRAALVRAEDRSEEAPLLPHGRMQGELFGLDLPLASMLGQPKDGGSLLPALHYSFQSQVRSGALPAAAGLEERSMGHGLGLELRPLQGLDLALEAAFDRYEDRASHYAERTRRLDWSGTWRLAPELALRLGARRWATAAEAGTYVSAGSRLDVQSLWDFRVAEALRGQLYLQLSRTASETFDPVQELELRTASLAVNAGLRLPIH